MQKCDHFQMNNEDRFTALEIKIAYQEKLNEDLSEVLSRQQMQIDLLEKALKDLKEKASSQNAPEIGPPGEKPPHY